MERLVPQLHEVAGWLAGRRPTCPRDNDGETPTSASTGATRPPLPARPTERAWLRLCFKLYDQEKLIDTDVYVRHRYTASRSTRRFRPVAA
jgi:hypothetical protein